MQLQWSTLMLVLFGYGAQYKGGVKKACKLNGMIVQKSVMVTIVILRIIPGIHFS